MSGKTDPKISDARLAGAIFSFIESLSANDEKLLENGFQRSVWHPRDETSQAKMPDNRYPQYCG